MIPIPPRTGPRPETKGPAPHEQASQIAPTDLQEEMYARVSSLPNVITGPSHTSVPGARGFHLEPEAAGGPREAFLARGEHSHVHPHNEHPGPNARGAAAVLIARTEFAHIHPPYDGSMHLRLPPDVAAEAQAKGWIEPHPVVAETLLVFGPRDTTEVEIVWQLVRESYGWARGVGSEHAD